MLDIPDCVSFMSHSSFQTTHSYFFYYIYLHSIETFNSFCMHVHEHACCEFCILHCSSVASLQRRSIVRNGGGERNLLHLIMFLDGTYDWFGFNLPTAKAGIFLLAPQKLTTLWLNMNCLVYEGSLHQWKRVYYLVSFLGCRDKWCLVPKKNNPAFSSHSYL